MTDQREDQVPQLVLAQGSILQDVPFENRVEAAAGAGFDGIGLSLTEYARLQELGYTDNRLRDILDKHNVNVVELEAVFGFAVHPDLAGAEPIPGLRYADDTSIDRLAALADLFGSRRIQSCGSFGSGQMEDDVVERFACVCDYVGPDIQITLEFQRCTNIGDADLAAGIVDTANRANGGLCVDSWHHFRGADNLDLLAALPADKIFLIQLADGYRQPVHDDYVEDTLRSRLAPGEGDWPLADFLDAIWSTGARPPLSVEVMSDAYRSLAPSHIAARLGDATRTLLATSKP